MLLFKQLNYSCFFNVRIINQDSCYLKDQGDRTNVKCNGTVFYDLFLLTLPYTSNQSGIVGTLTNTYTPLHKQPELEQLFTCKAIQIFVS